jgi:hypothetical protein
MTRREKIDIAISTLLTLAGLAVVCMAIWATIRG